MEATKTKMAAVLLVLAFVAVDPASAADHTVGGNSGWALGVNYDTWASSQTFRVGDKLVFKYGPSHTVDVLSSKSDYDNCNIANPVTTQTSSPTTITLSKAGTTYYACGTPGHCQQGMKLEVTTVAASEGSSPATPPSSSSPPTPSTTPATTTPSTTPATTAPSTPSAATSVIVGGKAILPGAVAALTGLAALLG